MQWTTNSCTYSNSPSVLWRSRNDLCILQEEEKEEICSKADCGAESS